MTTLTPPIEALPLYEPLPMAVDFHRSNCRIRLVRGSSRGGKTLAVIAEGCRAFTGQDPYHKYPRENGRCFVVCKNLDLIGQVLWYKMGWPGTFKIIPDPETGLWRAYHPWETADARRAAEARPAPPLLPQRMIESIAWENKSKNIPRMVRLFNGWEIIFCSSEAKPPQGGDLDVEKARTV